MKKCDHFIGMHHQYEMLILESERKEYFDDEDHSGITTFRYCPKCGGSIINEQGKLSNAEHSK